MKKTRKSLQALAGSKQLSLLPEPDFTPKLPHRNTLSARALSMMLQGRKISHPDFEDKTSSWRLAAHIYNLNKLGWPVQTIEVEHLAEKKPVKRYIRRYYLAREVINKVKEMGVPNG